MHVKFKKACHYFYACRIQRALDPVLVALLALSCCHFQLHISACLKYAFIGSCCKLRILFFLIAIYNLHYYHHVVFQLGLAIMLRFKCINLYFVFPSHTCRLSSACCISLSLSPFNLPIVMTIQFVFSCQNVAKFVTANFLFCFCEEFSVFLSLDQLIQIRYYSLKFPGAIFNIRM